MSMFELGRRGATTPAQAGGTAGEGVPGEEFPPMGGFEGGAAGGVRMREMASIGASIHIEGTLRGEEDLIIDGRVTGTVELQDHALTIGTNGDVHADLRAHTITVEGRVHGDIQGVDRVIIRSSAEVSGNIIAPRVVLEDGAWFRGSIEMDPDAVAKAVGRRPEPQTTPERDVRPGPIDDGPQGPFDDTLGVEDDTDTTTPNRASDEQAS